MNDVEKRINDLNRVISNIGKDLRKAKEILRKLEEDLNKKKYEDIPGVVGCFDGRNMIDKEGKLYEVNPNYAAKSMLVMGDELKMVEENGKTIFKQVKKVEREKVTGVVNKKDGGWCVLTDKGSFKILRTAVEYQSIKVNDKVVVVVPVSTANVEYAALEKVENRTEEALVPKEVVDEGGVRLDKEDEEKKKPKKAVMKKPSIKKKDTKEKNPVAKKPSTRILKSREKPEVAKPESKVLDEDDLR